MRIFRRRKILNIELRRPDSNKIARKREVKNHLIDEVLEEVKSFLAKNVKEKQDKSLDSTDFIVDIIITRKK